MIEPAASRRKQPYISYSYNCYLITDRNSEVGPRVPPLCNTLSHFRGSRASDSIGLDVVGDVIRGHSAPTPAPPAPLAQSGQSAHECRKKQEARSKKGAIAVTGDLVPPDLPTLSERLSLWLGFQVHLPALPQTLRNLDKAVGSVVGAVGENATARVNRNTTAVKARARNDAAIISASKKLLLERLGTDDELTRRALNFAFRDGILKQGNRETIVQRAVKDIIDQAGQISDAAEELDDDWLNTFADLAGTKSNEDIQSLWAKILAEKIRRPSSFSLQSLQYLAGIDANDAKLIHKYLSLAINHSYIYRFLDLDFAELRKCENIGVITGTSLTAKRLHSIHTTEVIEFSADDKPFIFALKTKTIVAIPTPAIGIAALPVFRLTRFGSELSPLITEPDVDLKYENAFLVYLTGFMHMHIQT